MVRPARSTIKDQDPDLQINAPVTCDVFFCFFVFFFFLSLMLIFLIFGSRDRDDVHLQI